LLTKGITNLSFNKHGGPLGLSFTRFLRGNHKDFYQCIANVAKSAAIFICQVAAWVPDMICNFYLIKNFKIAKNSTTNEDKGEK
jgi:hypothetical protein